MQEIYSDKMNLITQRIFRNKLDEVQRMTAIEISTDGHTGVHYDVLAEASQTGKCTVSVTLLRDAQDNHSHVLHVSLFDYTGENGLEEFLIAFCGFKPFNRCPLVNDRCLYKELSCEDISDKVNVLPKLTLDTIITLQAYFLESSRIWRNILLQARNGLGVDIPHWEQVIEMFSLDQSDKHSPV